MADIIEYPDAVYQLSDRRSPVKKSLIFLLLGTGWLLLALIFWGKLIGFVGLGLGVLGILIFLANVLGKNTQQVVLTPDRLIVRNKAVEKAVYLSEISKAELTVVQNNAVKKLPFFSTGSYEVDKMTQLSVVDFDNKRLEIKASDFDLADFRAFLDVLQSQSTSQGLEQDEELDRLLEQSELFIRQDTQLKQELEQMLLEAYKSFYHARGSYYLSKHPEARVMYEHRLNANEATYFLEGDYLAEYPAETIQNSKALLETAHKNIDVVNVRLEGHYQINDKLCKMKAAQETRNRIQKVSGKLETLQNRNMAELSGQQEHALAVETLQQLKQLTQELSDSRDLDKLILLKEQASILNG